MNLNGGHWTNRAPRGVIDPYDAHGQPVFTPTDRRWLWRIAGDLAVSAPMGSALARLGNDLREYLGETCEHHWSHLSVDDVFPAMRQCIWCNWTEDEVTA